MLNQTWLGRTAHTEHPELSPFSAGSWNRPLRLLIDDDDVVDSDALALLRSLADRPSVEVYSTKGTTAYRALVKELRPGDPDTLSVCLERGEDFTRQFVGSPAHLNRESRSLAARTAQPLESVRTRLGLAQLWAEAGYDAIVTNGSFFTEAWGEGFTASLKRPESALSELGLCLRANGDFVVEREGKGTVSMSSSFHATAAIGALPSYSGWHAAALIAWHRSESAQPYVLLKSFITRLSRALRALDYVRVRRFHPRINEAWGDLLFFFDVLLVALDGALDCLARFFHFAFDVPGQERWASWDKSEFPEALGNAAPELAPLVRVGSRLPDVATAVARLRNTVHGEVLSNEHHGWEDSPTISDFGAGKLLITEPDAAALGDACDRLGLERLVEMRFETGIQSAALIDADIFGCAMTREVLGCAEELLEVADCTRLPEPPEDFDLSQEVPPVAYQHNAALLAAIPPWGDRYMDLPAGSVD